MTVPKHHRPGVPDILGFSFDGRFIGIEVKTPEGKTSDEQKQFHSTALRCRSIVFVAQSVDDVIVNLKKML